MSYIDSDFQSSYTSLSDTDQSVKEVEKENVKVTTPSQVQAEGKKTIVSGPCDGEHHYLNETWGRSSTDTKRNPFAKGYIESDFQSSCTSLSDTDQSVNGDV